MPLIIFVNEKSLSWNFGRTLAFYKPKLSANLWQDIVTETAHFHIPWEHSVKEARVEPIQISKVEFFAECRQLFMQNALF